MRHSLVFALTSFSGCAFIPGQTDKWKSHLPKYMQENIGEVTTEFLHLDAAFCTGWVGEDGDIHLRPSATEGVFFHECMHSFEMNMERDNPVEHALFAEDYINIEYEPKVEIYSCFVPAVWIPARDAPNLYARIDHWENTAESFRFFMLGHATDSDLVKSNVKTIERFVTGQYHSAGPQPVFNRHLTSQEPCVPLPVPSGSS